MGRLAYVLVPVLFFLGGFLTSEYRHQALKQESASTVALSPSTQAPDSSRTLMESRRTSSELAAAVGEEAVEERAASAISLQGRGEHQDSIDISRIDEEMETVASNLQEAGLSEEQIQQRIEALQMRLIEEGQQTAFDSLDRTNEELRADMRASLQEAGMSPEYVERTINGLLMAEGAESQSAIPEEMAGEAAAHRGR